MSTLGAQVQALQKVIDSFPFGKRVLFDRRQLPGAPLTLGPQNLETPSFDIHCQNVFGSSFQHRWLRLPFPSESISILACPPHRPFVLSPPSAAEARTGTPTCCWSPSSSSGQVSISH